MDLSGAKWQTSSYSSGNGGQCVEVARNLPGFVAVRDSRNRGGSALVFPAPQWQAFAARLRSGERRGG